MTKWLAILITFLTTTAVQAGNPGSTSANFLKLGIGPRAIAMGEAQVGLADDVYASYWNPAGLAQLQSPEAGFVHTQYLQGVRTQHAAYAQPAAGLGTLAGHFTYLQVDPFDAYDAQGQPAGNVTAHDMCLALNYARALARNSRKQSSLSIGLTGKWLQEQLDTVTATAYAVDLGALYAPGRRWGDVLEGFRAGVVVRNLGTSMKFDRDAFDLPRSLTAGLSWTGVWLGESLTLALDGTQPNDGRRTFGAGLELWTLRLLVLRVGYSSHSDLGNGLRLGTGIRLRTILVDYAISGAGDFGTIHRIGLTLRFGSIPQNPEAAAEQWYVKGQKAFRRTRYSEALAHFNKALETDPTHPEALRMMKETYEQLKRSTTP